MGSNKWRRYSSWPPAVRETKFYLRNAEKDRFGILDRVPPGDEPSSEYDYDPNDPAPTLGGNHSIWFHHQLVPVGAFDHSPHEQRPDVLIFSTSSVSEDMEVTGPVAVNFWASSDATDTDWTAILLDVEPDGKPYNVTMGILRARYRRGIFKAPELLTPDAVERYNLELMPTSYRFKKGHQVRLYLSSSNFPLWDRNPNTGGEIHTETKTRVARQTIYHDSSRSSHLVLPIVSGG
jgi:putative CocE/NonD family hydrolase